MSIDPRTELTRLLDALEAHLTAVVNRTGEHDSAVDEAYVEIANAFEAYEDALFEAYNEVTPLSVYGDEARMTLKKSSTMKTTSTTILSTRTK